MINGVSDWKSCTFRARGWKIDFESQDGRACGDRCESELHLDKSTIKVSEINGTYDDDDTGGDDDDGTYDDDENNRWHNNAFINNAM